MHSKKDAYTLVELLVVMGIFLSSTLVLIPFSLNKIQEVKVSTKAIEMTSDIFETQQRAYVAKSNSSYGIKLNSNNYIIYFGNDLATSTDFDQFNLPNNISIVNINLSPSSTEIQFAKNSLFPTQSGSFDLTDGINTYRIQINKEGNIYYEEV